MEEIFAKTLDGSKSVSMFPLSFISPPSKTMNPKLTLSHHRYNQSVQSGTRPLRLCLHLEGIRTQFALGVMGVGGHFWDLLKPNARHEGPDFLRNKRIAVDLSFWIVQHETAIKTYVRKPHLRITFFRTINLYSKVLLILSLSFSFSFGCPKNYKLRTLWRNVWLGIDFTETPKKNLLSSCTFGFKNIVVLTELECRSFFWVEDRR